MSIFNIIQVYIFSLSRSHYNPIFALSSYRHHQQHFCSIVCGRLIYFPVSNYVNPARIQTANTAQDWQIPEVYSLPLRTTQHLSVLLGQC